MNGARLQPCTDRARTAEATPRTNAEALRAGAAALRTGSAALCMAATALCLSTVAAAHGIAGKDASFVTASRGAQFIPFLYLGAKHMVTGYDHLLFIVGVVFFLYRIKDVALYVTAFSLGHSITLLAGTLFDMQVNTHLVDAAIGASILYKAFDNLDGFRTLLGAEPNAVACTFGFGLIHGLGLATKLQSLHPVRQGLLANMLAFNVGVELGQLAVLFWILAVMTWWRGSSHFSRQALAANALLLTAGMVLLGWQLAAFYLGAA